jgi:hypothetical protein
MKNIDYRKAYLDKSDKFLLDIYKNKRGYYEDAVITTIEQILKERNVVFDTLELANEHTTTEKIDADYAPMIVGMFAIIIGGLIAYTNQRGDEMGFGIWYMVILRLVFVAYSINLSDKYTQNKVLWIILILLFGSWALIFQNLAFIVSNNVKVNNANLESLKGTNTSFSIIPEEVKVATEYDFESENISRLNKYTNCPACLKSLNGTNKCIDCDLEFK